MKSILSLFLLLACSVSFAQPVKHVKWTTEYKSTGKNEGEIVIKATIDKGWHTYSQKASEGPVPTSFKFAPSNSYELIGTPSESASIEEFDKTFEAKVFLFNDSAEFRQKIKLKNKSSNIAITVEYMTCNDAMCAMAGPAPPRVHAPSPP